MAPRIKRLLKQLLKKTQEIILGENLKENSALNKSEILMYLSSEYKGWPAISYIGLLLILISLGELKI